MSNEQNAIEAKLDGLPMEDLSGYSEKYFNSEEDSRRVPTFDSRFLIIKIKNQSQVFEFQDQLHDDFTGVIIDFHLNKTWYEQSFLESGGGNRPDCYSNDSVTPLTDSPRKQAKKCALCPKNQWEKDPTREGKKKKDCSDSITLYLWNPRFELPLLLRVSTMNRSRVSDFIKLLASRKIAKEVIVCKFTLFEDKETGSVPFSGLEIDIAGTVPQMVEHLKEEGKREVALNWFTEAEIAKLTPRMIVERIAQFKNENAELFETQGALASAESNKPSSNESREESRPGDSTDDGVGDNGGNEPPF